VKHHISRWLSVHIPLLLRSLRDAVPTLLELVAALTAIIRRLRRRCGLSERERRRSPDLCVPINEPAYKRPDPLIYDQFYLMSLGFAVTWDNPDIQLYRGGVPVPSSGLDPDTEYDVVARVWNGSTEAPVMGLPVHFSFLSFGVQTVSHPIGSTIVDLGVPGGPNHPAFATVKWRTPATPGHYCIQTLLDWFDDANPANNLGQENTSVGKAHSPASFEFVMHNPTRESLQYRFEVDAYRIPLPPPCGEITDPAARVREARARHNRNRFPLPAGWSVTFSPSAPELAPGADQMIAVEVAVPAGFHGTQAINVHAFNRYGLAGGVTLYVEGA
jgi:hypothetical protein